MQATALVPPNYLTDVDDAEELADESDLTEDQSQLVEEIVRRRKRNRGGAPDMVIVVEDWAVEDWSDADIAEEKVILARFVDDHSEKAIKVEDGHYARLSEAEGRSAEEAMDMSLGDLVEIVDETDGDFHDAMGEMYLPKSALDSIYRFQNLDD